MSKINYYLKGVPAESVLQQLEKENPKKFKEAIRLERPIILSVAYNGRRDIFSTGRFASLKNWDRKKMEIKLFTDSLQSNRDDKEWLENKRLEIEKFLSVAAAQFRVVEKKDLIELIKGKTAALNLSVRRNIKEVLAEFKLAHKTRDGASLKNNTFKKYNTTIDHFITFQGNEVFTPHLYTTDFIKKFKMHLLLNCCDNTVCKYVDSFKIFLSHFKKKGVFIPAQLDEIIVSEKEQVVNILEESELKILEDIVLNNPYHDRVRDVFLFQCYTGARYSDVHACKQQDIFQKDDMQVWEYIDEKTGKNITVPLINKALDLLEKYKELPTPIPRYSNQKMNDVLKIIAKEAKLNRTVKLVYHNDNRKSEKHLPLHELISTHMARKTFVSLSVQMGIPERWVREISGHKDERSFRRYLNLGKSHLKAVSLEWNRLNKVS